MNCQTFRTQHLAFVDLALQDEAHRAMTLHRDTCDACDSFDSTVRRALLVARNLPDVRPSSAFSTRLDAKLRAVRLVETASQRANPVSRPATLRTMMVVAASLLGMIYVAERGAGGSDRAGMTEAVTVDGRDLTRAAEKPRPMPRIYSAPLRSPAVVTVVSTASNAEWMLPTPGVPAPSAFAPVVIEAVAFVR